MYFGNFLDSKKLLLIIPLLCNVIFKNLIMKDKIFLETKILCNIRCSEPSTLGEKFGSMSPEELEQAIQDNRNNQSIQYLNSGEHRFLRSIQSTCGKLPYSNKACLDARRTYFSFLMKFGIPAIFLTINPDDLRNFRIVVYSNPHGQVSPYGEVNLTTYLEANILSEFNVRSTARSQHPGLCAEEYQ
jgi:hypothetical protein